MIKCLLPSLFAIWLALTSFFWSNDQEKQLRNLLQTAETALNKEAFEEAKESYEELIGKVGVNTTKKYKVDWPTYVDIILRYTDACEALGDLEDGEEALTKLLSHSLPKEQVLRVKLRRAHFIANQTSPAQAYLEMQSLAKNSMEKWSAADLSFFHAIEYALDKQYDESIQKAKRLLVTGHYSEAITLYQNVLDAIEKGHYPKASIKHSLIAKKIRYRLAESHYKQANFDQSLALCYNESAVEDRIDREMIYLSALCYSKREEYKKAIERFQTYMGSHKNADDLLHYTHALFEMGLSHYQAKNYKNAKYYFGELQSFHGKPRNLAALYLARLHLEEKCPQNVPSVLFPIIQTLKGDDLLVCECYYLLGEASYALEEYEKAQEYFERSLCIKNRNRPCNWIKEAFFNLGCCYTQLAIQHKSMSSYYFEKGTEIFKELLQSKNNEKAALALARLYLLKNEPDAIESLLSPFSSLDALLLRARATQNYSKKEKLLQKATDAKFSDEIAYGDAWYERGLNYFQEGLKDKKNGASYFEKAVLAFRDSFRSKNLACTLKLEARALAYTQASATSITLLETLLDKESDTDEQKEETLYIKGLIASRLSDPAYFSTAEEAFKEVIKEKRKYANEALFALGTLYFEQKYYAKAIDTFVTLASNQPHTPYTGDAWFWAAEAAEKIEDPRYKNYRAHVYQDDPTSNKAAESYFRQYRYQDYLKGKKEALLHLHGFSNRFPHSPILVITHYLIGMHTEAFERKKACFEEAIKCFSFCSENGKVPESSFVYFRYQSMLRLAQHYLDHTFLDQALHLLTTLIKDFSTIDHPLLLELTKNTPYPLVYREAEYTLVQAYLKQGKTLRAQETINLMLEHFEKASIQKGLYLSQAWKEQGLLAHQCHDYATAIKCFDIAQHCGEGYLDEEQALTLWLVQSHAHRDLKEYDQAMLLLSKVINTGGPSPARLKAMFYRAEIYELQGRPELAVRQLEAMTKKGGNWAMEAQEKLRREYGL